MGKLSPGSLKELLKCVKTDSSVVIPPSSGFDSGVHLIDDKYLVISTDPCIGVPKEWFGWLLLNYASSDVALFGAHPRYCTINLLGPPKTTSQTFLTIMKQICKAADEIQMTIITGHTGTYPGISTVVGVCTAYGIIEKDKLITPSGAKPGNLILCTKPIGLELAVNVALTKKKLANEIFGYERTKELRRLVKMQSCVHEALQLAEAGCVDAMHDATEGGLTAALKEMAVASNVGFKIDFEKIPVCEEARSLQRHFDLSDEQLLSMSSTGTIVASVKPTQDQQVTEILNKEGLSASFIGSFEKTKHQILFKDGKEMAFRARSNDPYETILSGQL